MKLKAQCFSIFCQTVGQRWLWLVWVSAFFVFRLGQVISPLLTQHGRFARLSLSDLSSVSSFWNKNVNLAVGFVPLQDCTQATKEKMWQQFFLPLMFSRWKDLWPIKMILDGLFLFLRSWCGERGFVFIHNKNKTSSQNFPYLKVNKWIKKNHIVLFKSILKSFLNDKYIQRKIKK